MAYRSGCAGATRVAARLGQFVVSRKSRHDGRHARNDTDRSSGMKAESPHGSSVLLVGGPEMAPLVADLERASQVVDLTVERRVASGSSEVVEALARSQADVAVVEMTS